MDVRGAVLVGRATPSSREIVAAALTVDTNGKWVLDTRFAEIVSAQFSKLFDAVRNDLLDASERVGLKVSEPNGGCLPVRELRKRFIDALNLNASPTTAPPPPHLRHRLLPFTLPTTTSS